MRSPTLPHASGPALALGGKLEAEDGGPIVNRTKPEEDAMTTISEVERPGLAVRAFYKIGEAMFGKVPTPERIMAHRVPLMLGLGALYGSLEWLGRIDTPLRALLNVHVAELYGSAY
jgi:hypothetical protein